ncbi:transcriptional regulator [uncultured Polaribacter sp.]|uniref:transcriptional regulator n=1 Tax=uncultured Polaribacter sp. TaxID=174711 RepID=UPI0026310FA3|nr:transcriptional regulator [uncultured Polaribacter sp.]
MNYIKHLTGFFDKVINDHTLNPTHISLYIALFQFWNCNRFRNPISISRDEVMRISKISSKATYHKCLKNLHALGYLRYEPSYNPYKGSMVFMFNFSENLKPKKKSFNKQVRDKQQTSNQPTSEQAEVSYINNTNSTNSINKIKEEEQSQNVRLENKEEVSKQKKFRQKNKSKVPVLEEVIKYFQEQNFPKIEANKFYNYFSSNGWLVGGKTPMKNWKAAAKNWILNSEKYSKNNSKKSIQPQNLSTSTNKNYSEPL